MQSQTEDLHCLFLCSCVSGFESCKQLLVHMFRSSNPTSNLVHKFLGSNPTNKFIYFCVRIWPATSSSHLSGFEPGQQLLVHLFLFSNLGRSLAHVFLCSNSPSIVHFTSVFLFVINLGITNCATDFVSRVMLTEERLRLCWERLSTYKETLYTTRSIIWILISVNLIRIHNQHLIFVVCRAPVTTRLLAGTSYLAKSQLRSMTCLTPWTPRGYQDLWTLPENYSLMGFIFPFPNPKIVINCCRCAHKKRGVHIQLSPLPLVSIQCWLKCNDHAVWDVQWAKTRNEITGMIDTHRNIKSK